MLKIMKVYKIVEVADIVHSHPETVKSEIKRNKLKAFKVGSEYRITEQALEDYLGVLANNYKTQREMELEKENANLMNKLATYEEAISSIKNNILSLK